MSTQFDVKSKAVLNGLERLKEWREINLPFPEFEVIVDAGFHVLDMDVVKDVLPIVQKV